MYVTLGLILDKSKVCDKPSVSTAQKEHTLAVDDVSFAVTAAVVTANATRRNMVVVVFSPKKSSRTQSGSKTTYQTVNNPMYVEENKTQNRLFFFPYFDGDFDELVCDEDLQLCTGANCSSPKMG